MLKKPIDDQPIRTLLLQAAQHRRTLILQFQLIESPKSHAKTSDYRPINSGG